MRYLRALGVAAVAGLLGLSAPAQAEPRDYVMDKEHFAIAFMVHHLGLADTVGMFREASGSFTFDDETGELSDVVITVQTDSVFTNHEDRDEHLRGPDFLNVGEYPTMTFTAEDAVKTGGDTAKVKGKLTLLGTTKPLTLDVTYNGARDYPFGDGHHAIGISARGTVTRSDYGMTYAVDNDLVGDEIELIIEFEAMYNGS
jgi:polyisoprenoid-binding protein YceI